MDTQGWLGLLAGVVLWTVVWHVILGLGITVGYHRLLTHRGFKTPQWVEYILVTLGYLALQGPPQHWVAVHRIHHAYSDQPLDPHSPVQKGWWYGQLSWLWDRRNDPETQYETFPVLSVVNNRQAPEYCKRWCPELDEHRYYRFLENGFVFVGAQLLSMGLAFMIAGPVGLVGRVLATFTSFSSTGWVNSFCHMRIWGASAPFRHKTKDESQNIWWVAIAALGEGWHNNHHAFQRSACHGLLKGQFDISWMLIRLLQGVGLAKDIIRPAQADVQRALTSAASKGPQADPIPA